MDDTDLESVGQERAVGPAPEAVFRTLRTAGAEPGHVVAPVVVHDQQASARPHDAVGLGDLAGVDSSERRPGTDEYVGPRLWRAGPARRFTQGDGTNPRAERGQPVDEHFGLAANPRDIAIGTRAERVERTRNLALDVEGGGETKGERFGQRDGQV